MEKRSRLDEFSQKLLKWKVGDAFFVLKKNMGATKEIKGTNLSLQLRDKKCFRCSKKFTEKDLDDGNYEVWFDTTNDVSLIPMEELAKKTALESLSTEYFKRLYFPFKHDGYQFAIWIRSIEHEYCPTVEEEITVASC